jgi:hypothetical protein
MGHQTGNHYGSSQHVRVPAYLAKHSATYPAESSCTHICWAETAVQVAIAAAATAAAGSPPGTVGCIDNQGFLVGLVSFWTLLQLGPIKPASVWWVAVLQRFDACN